MSSLKNKVKKIVDGLGRTAKTFIYRTIMANLRRNGEIIIVIASSGIVVTLLLVDGTAHS